MNNYIWRPAQESDLQALNALDAACLPIDKPASVSWSWAAYEDLLASPEAAMLCATIGGLDQDTEQIVAVGWVRMSDTQARVGGKVHPAHRRKGLGSYLLRWAEAQARTLGNPTSLMILNEAFREGSEAEALYEQEGYARTLVQNWMQRDLRAPMPAIAQTFHSVAWSPENARLFFDVYKEAFSTRRLPGSPEPVAEQWINANIEDEDFRPDLARVAYVDGEPAGFITPDVVHITQLNQTVGWISQVGVAPAWRGRGVAAWLITTTMEAMMREGLAAVGLHVNVNNPGAIQLYERLGFKLMGQRAAYSKPCLARLPGE